MSASWIGAAVEGGIEVQGSSSSRNSACHIAGKAVGVRAPTQDNHAFHPLPRFYPLSKQLSPPRTKPISPSRFLLLPPPSTCRGPARPPKPRLLWALPQTPI